MRAIVGVCVPLACLGLAGCAGYQLGTATLFRADIRTVYVPMFESDSYRRNLSEWLTEAVVKEIERKSPYKIVSDPLAADSVLTGRIVGESKSVLAETINDDPRNVEVNWVVQISWVDRRGDAIMPMTSFSLAQQGFRVAEAGDFVPEAGQSITSANQQIITQIARQIVGQMEAPW
jgi:hypothetical protein